MTSDFSDIRFTYENSSGEYEIPYWIEKKVDSSWAYVWVKIPEIPANDNATVYVYYGNSLATSESNGTATWIVFEDFEDGTYDTNRWGWYGNEGTYSVSTTEKYEGNYGLESVVGASASAQLRSIDGNTYDSGRILIYIKHENTDSTYVYLGDGTGTTWGTALTRISFPRSTQWKSLEIVWINASSTSQSGKVFYDGNEYTLEWIETGQVGQTLFNYRDQNASYDVYCFGKYTTPEPTYSIGSEEENPGTPPQYSNIVVSPSSPQTYGISNIWFNITWEDDEGVDKAWIVHNFSGSEETYVMQNDTPTHFYYLLDFTPSAGNYSYQFFANDTNGAQNSTDVFTYEIQKALTEFHLAINGTESDITYTYPVTTNATAWTNETGFEGVTLYRNGSSVSNPEIIELPAGVYNYTAVFQHQNYTAENSTIMRILTINKADSQLTLTASPGWTVPENSEVTISCSATSPLSVTLYKDGVVVSNPYSAVLPYGIYNFTCVISDTQNYTPASMTKFLTVQTGGFGCTNTNTFAFKTLITGISGDEIVLDFSSLIDEHYVKSDLSDVYPNTTNDPKGWVNGTYFIVNTTGLNNVTVLFGNYFANYQWSSKPYSASPQNFSYEEINPYTVLTFIEEIEGVELLPPNANTTISLYCAGGSSSVKVNDTKILVASFMDLDEIRAWVSYSATEVYVRSLISRASVEFKNMYLVDAEKHQVVQMLISLQDNTGKFENATLKVKKWMEGTLQTVTEQYFDAEHKAIVYLINNDKYQLYIDNGEEERGIGYLYVDTTDLDKTIIIGELVTYNQTIANVSFGLTYDGDIITFTWLDPAGLTTQVEFWVYNYSNDAELYYANSTNRTKVSFTYIVPIKNITYYAKYRIKHQVFGTHTSEGKQILVPKGYYAMVTFPFSSLVTWLSGSWVWFTMLMLLPIPMLFDIKYAGIGGIVLIAIAWLLKTWVNYPIPDGILIIAFVFAVLLEVWIRRRYQE